MNTQITFVLDSSGSMSAIKDDTIGGYNTFLDEQLEEPGKATVTLYDFNTSVELIYEGRPIEKAPLLSEDNYTPNGRTALHDAIYIAISDTEGVIDWLSPPPWSLKRQANTVSQSLSTPQRTLQKTR